MSLSQQMRHRDREMVPRILVRAMFGLMAAALALVAVAQWTDRPNTGVLAAIPVTDSRAVVIEGARGHYAWRDAATGAVLATSSEPGLGFLSVLGTALERHRGRAEVALSAPLEIVRRENGRIGLVDPSTGWRVDLIGYGRDNVAAVAAMLD
ncbi:MAG: photosynthetic complex assembly protein PuhC [Paracoccaceae bacterium]